MRTCAQVLFASAVKCGVRPPKDPSQLYEVDDGMSSIKGSRKMVHSNQYRRACSKFAAALPMHCLL